MEKQYKTQIKDYLIKHIAEELDYPENICEAVISWVYKDTIEQTHEVASIELSGFGSLLVSKAKLKKRLETCRARINNPAISPALAEKDESNLKFLESKIRTDEIRLERNMGGMAQSSSASRSSEGEDREDITGEVVHM